MVWDKVNNATKGSFVRNTEFVNNQSRLLPLNYRQLF